MRTIRRLSVVLVLALVAAACGGGDDDDGTPSGQAQAPAALNENAELKVGFVEDQYVLEGPETSLAAYPLNTNVLETLTYLDANYKVQPRLAERWEFRAPNTWRFFLRRGVTFHDGTPFNAQAAKVGIFDRVATRRGGGTIRSGPNSVTIIDDYTLDFTPLSPNVRVPEQIVHPHNGAIAPGSDPGRRPIGTGPFRFVEYLPKERIVVERNATYWGEKAKVARINFRFYPDSNARLLALQAGDIDLAYQIPRDDVKGLKDRGFNIQNSTVGAYRGMFANVFGEAPFDILKDVNVRKAVSMAIDRKALVDGVLSGLATGDQTFIPPSVIGSAASEIKGIPYDLNQARSLLDTAGWRAGSDGIREKAGRKLKLVLVSGFPSAEALRPTPTFVQSELKKAGIDVEIQERPDSASFQSLMTEKRGDLFIEEGNQNDANVGFLPVLLLYTGPGSSPGPYGGISAPGATFNSLIEPSITEPDLAKTQLSVARALNELITNQVTFIPLAGIYRIYGMKSSVQGFVPHPSFLNVSWLGVGVASR
jgi:peptide/nickel transport system substrate-binding protein